MSKRIPVMDNPRDKNIYGYALVDDEDYKWLSDHEWYEEHGHAHVRIPKFNSMHRMVMDKHGLLKHNRFGEMKWTVDHINGNRLDNRKKNMRMATYSQNRANQKARLSKHGYKGVEWDGQRNKWKGRVIFQGKRIWLGRFDTKKEAAKAYDNKAKELWGDFADLNLPETSRLT